MSTAHEEVQEEQQEPITFGAAQWAGLLVAVAAAIASAFLFHTILPALLAAAIALVMPKRELWTVRIPLAVIAGLLTLFVVRLWPTTEIPEEVTPVVESHRILSFILGVPLATAVAILFMPRQAHRLLQWTTMLAMLATIALSVPLLRVPMERGFHFNQDFVWMERFGIHYHVALDGVSLWLVMLTVVTTPIAAYASFGSVHARIKDWCFSLLLLEGAMIGAFVALDLFLFYVFWELMLIPMYVIIGVWGGTNRIKSAIKFFLYTMFGSVLMLAAILYLAYAYAKLSGGQASFDFFELQRVLLPFSKDPAGPWYELPRGAQFWLFAAFSLSFFIKVPMWPVHTWLPDAHTEAPTAGSVILAAVLLKMGTYGYMRFCLGLFPEASNHFGATLAGVAVLGGILYGALCAWRQDDVKRLVAYSSVAHLGYVMLGLFAVTQASMEGSVLQQVNHGISTGALFLLVGVIYDRRHTRHIDDFGGLAKPMPLYAAIFVIATLASIGLPGTNGFIGEFMVITGTFVSNRLGHVSGIQAVGAAIGVILGALYMLSVVQKVFFGPVTKKENEKLPDLNGRELVALAPLVGLIFIIGFFPNIFLGQIKDAAARIGGDYEARLSAHLNYDGPMRLLPRAKEATPQVGAPQAAPGVQAAPEGK
jgi:NADH-quinone oxidoreductase subunit M